jgi:hypothetical protein
VQTLSIRARPGTTLTTPVFGNLILTETGNRSAPLRLTIAIAGTAEPGLIFREGYEGAD